MDDQYSGQTNADAYQQNDLHQQEEAYQQSPYQQGGPYQQGNAYQQGGPYQQGSAYQQGGPYQQGNAYQQGGPYQQGSAYQQESYYQQGSAYQQGGSYQQGNVYQQGAPYQQGISTGNGYGNYGGGFESQKAPNIFQQFALSFVPTQYDRLTQVKTGSMIGFVTLLVLLASVISFIYVAASLASLDMGELAEQLPDFAIADGRLYMDEEFLYDEAGVFVYMTEEIDSFSYEDAEEIAEEGYQNIILVGRDRISILQNGEYQQADFSDFGNSIEISRDWIATTLGPLLMVLLAVGYVVAFLVRVCWYFLCAAVYLLFAMIIASIMKKQLEAGALFRTAVYAKVLMFVIGTVLGVIPFVNYSVPFFLRVVITVVFMGLAIAKLPDSRQAPMAMGQGWR